MISSFGDINESKFPTNPALGAAKADLWRYAVLYAVGGVYIDVDAFVETNRLEEKMLE